MKITLTKRQEIVNGKEKDVEYIISNGDEGWMSSAIFLKEEELADLRDEINRVLTDKDV